MTRGDTMRAILKEAHECMIPRWNGAFYVVPHYDCFILRGFGWNDHCPHFLVREQYTAVIGWNFTFEALP